jgi:hypothetical protein
MPQKTKKDRILSNFTKIEDTPNRTGADAAGTPSRRNGSRVTHPHPLAERCIKWLKA